MKKFLILGLALTALLTMEHRAEAYSSAVGVDPKNDDPGFGNTGYGDYETKAVVKSAASGASAAIVSNRVLAYTSAADGYTVTRQVTQTPAGLRLLACVSTDDIPTGDTAYHRCITKGFVRLKYNAVTSPIEVGVPACVDQEGIVRGCVTSDAEATVDTGIIPLEAKTDTGNFLKAMINLK